MSAGGLKTYFLRARREPWGQRPQTFLPAPPALSTTGCRRLCLRRENAPQVDTVSWVGRKECGRERLRRFRVYHGGQTSLRRDELDAAVPELLRFVVVVVRPAARVVRSDGDPQRAQQQFTALDSVLVELLLDGLRRVAGILDVA